MSPSIEDRTLLVALLGTKDGTGEGVADILLGEFLTLPDLLAAPSERIASLAGREAATLLSAVWQTAFRIGQRALESRPLIGTTMELVGHIRTAIGYNAHEEAWAIFLDTGNHVLASERLCCGTTDQVPIYPREIVRRALELGAKSIILAHNHPGGDPSPTEEDFAATKDLMAAASLMDIKLLDHVIVSRSGHISMRVEGRALWDEFDKLMVTSPLRDGSAEPAPAEPPARETTFVSLALALLKSRNRIAHHLGQPIVVDPVFQILLDLFVLTELGKLTSVSSCCYASGVPASTALRCIKDLEYNGFIVRSPDPSDGRRTHLSLSASCMASIRNWLAESSSIPLVSGT